MIILNTHRQVIGSFAYLPKHPGPYNLGNGHVLVPTTQPCYVAINEATTRHTLHAHHATMGLDMVSATLYDALMRRTMLHVEGVSESDVRKVLMCLASKKRN